MKKARIIYNANEDKFEIQINTGDGWGLDTAYRCVAREGGNGDTEFINWRILDKLRELAYQGYSIKWM